MVAWSQLLLPALLSTVLVFVASSIIHMVVKWHAPDYRKLPNEDEVLAAVKRGSPTPGQYVFPHCKDPKEAEQPEMKAKFEQGPVGVMYVRPSGAMKLGPFLGGWTLYCLVVALLVGYVTRATQAPGAGFAHVMQVAGVSAWMAFGWQGPSDSIWKGKPWIITARDLVDCLVYAVLMGATYAWLWPEA